MAFKREKKRHEASAKRYAEPIDASDDEQMYLYLISELCFSSTAIGVPGK